MFYEGSLAPEDNLSAVVRLRNKCCGWWTRILRERIADWNQQQIEELQQRNIIWKFQPPNARHMSGAWERLVKPVKQLFSERPDVLATTLVDVVVNQAYSRLSTTHGHITDCKLDSVVYVGVCVWVNVELSCLGRTMYVRQFLGAKPPIQFRHRWAERITQTI